MIDIKSIKKVDVLMYACVGGHLDQLVGISSSLADYSKLYVINDNFAARTELLGKTVKITFAERDWRQFINIFEALVIVMYSRPKVIISTGSAPAVWFFYIGKCFGAKLIFIESVARVDSLSLTGRLVKPVADYFFVQWESLAIKTSSRFAGTVNGD